MPLHIKLSEVAAGVIKGDEGKKELVFADQHSGITISAPLEAEHAEALADALRGTGIEVARQMPDTPIIDG